jgi:hypothetical protein
LSAPSVVTIAPLTTISLRLSRRAEASAFTETEASSFWRFWLSGATTFTHGYHHWERL